MWRLVHFLREHLSPHGWTMIKRTLKVKSIFCCFMCVLCFDGGTIVFMGLHVVCVISIFSSCAYSSVGNVYVCVCVCACVLIGLCCCVLMLWLLGAGSVNINYINESVISAAVMRRNCTHVCTRAHIKTTGRGQCGEEVCCVADLANDWWRWVPWYVRKTTNRSPALSCRSPDWT